MHLKQALTGVLATLLVAAPLFAQDRNELAKNNPVAIISLVQGDV